MVHKWACLWAAVLALPLAARADPGDLDPSFGAGGQVTTPILSGYDGASAVVVQPDGKLVAAGHAYNTNNDTFALVRYNADGSLDGNFGTGGKVTTPFGIGSAASAAVLQADGRLVAAGQMFTGSRNQFALVRYLATGGLDSTFGTGGKVGTPIGSIDDEASALVVQPDGKLVAAGYSDRGGNTTFALARYNAAGSLDTSFGTGGKVTTAIGSTDDEVLALVLQPDGKLVAAGFTASAGNTAFALVRYNADGSLDTSFGTGGKVTTSIGSVDDKAIALVLQPDGKLVAAGYSKGGSNIAFALARYNADGSLDASFGTAGKVTTAVESIDDAAFALLLQPDGKLVAAGYANDGSNEDFAVVRYSADGSLDASFGAGGKVVTQIAGTFGEANALVLQADGKLVAAGYSYNGTDTDFALARYLGQVCGDGIVEASEQCDAGAANGEHTSCCTTTCQFTASGTSCDDGNSCTYNESCDGSGACLGTAIAGCTTTTTTTTSSTTSTTTPCPDSGFEGVSCVLRRVVQPCTDEALPRPVQRRISQATSLADHGAGASKEKKASAFARKASKTLKKALALAAAANAKGRLSTPCGNALGGVLQEAAHRAQQLAASL